MLSHTPIPRLAVLLAGVALLIVAGFGCAQGTAQPESTGGSDAGADVADQDVSCPATACTIGQTSCTSPTTVVSCVDDGSGCGTLGQPSDCPSGHSCTGGRCIDASQCVDQDGDGYGENCPAGADCDDTSSAINPGGREICGDGVDNDCTGGPDDGCADPCANQVCVPGETRCAAGGQVQPCGRNANGCGEWKLAQDCPGNDTCENGACRQCVDQDGDGYGDGCPLGPDCDDGDFERNSGQAELCDGKDNNCTGGLDEGFSNLGQSCTAGTGACQSSGTYVCAADGRSTTCDAQSAGGGTELCGDNIDNDCDGDIDEGFGAVGQSCSRGDGACRTSGTYQCDASRTGTTCSAPAPNTSQASREICDGVDNDCDGSVDENSVCYTCVEDSLEDSTDSSGGAPLLAGGTTGELNSCGGCSYGTWDWDWYYLGDHSVGTQVGLELTHLTGTNAAGETYADLDAEFFCGTKFCDAIRGSSATTSGTFDGRCYDGSTCSSTRWAVHIYPRCSPNPGGNPASGTPYALRRY